MSVLTAARVEAIFEDALFNDSEITNGAIPEGAVLVRGIMMKVGFQPERLAAHKEEIIELLHALPVEFLSKALGGGDGWSFLNAANDKDGEQWTGLHSTMDLLFILGQGVGAVESIFDRENWVDLPGGMPYYRVIL